MTLNVPSGGALAVASGVWKCDISTCKTIVFLLAHILYNSEGQRSKNRLCYRTSCILYYLCSSSSKYTYFTYRQQWLALSFMYQSLFSVTNPASLSWEESSWGTLCWATVIGYTVFIDSSSNPTTVFVSSNTHFFSY